MATPTDLLRTALTDDPARPFLTFYDDGSDERIELSVRTFDNWVAKTANHLQDELALSAGSTLALALPTHWQAAVWLQACWALGVVVHPVPEDAPLPAADATVVAEPASGDVALTLRPALLAGREVLGSADVFVPYAPVGPDEAALVLDGRTWSREELGELGAQQAQQAGIGRGARTLSTLPLHDVAGIGAALLVPLAVGGSVVLCRDADPARLDARRVTERVDAP
ncbi:TIGR03089 family protein [Motilibacter rhizosphaerae]|uniref:TIGR03089 family protein n=1 Tax=Motilibacter rhizosphaerae TaxID=598652 RepID=UPI001E30E974|nr:TIGR03089 family protein [Motilibacter rhizosphaerae]